MTDPLGTPEPTELTWRPGKAGNSERAVMGSGTGTGWFLYFFRNYLVCEIWLNGDWMATRYLDCTEASKVPNAKYHVAAMGYSLDDNLISLGCVSLDASSRRAGLIHEDFYIEGLGSFFAHPPQLHFGIVPVLASSGTGVRYLNAEVRLLDGEMNSDEYLTRGKLSVLAGKLMQEVSIAP